MPRSLGSARVPTLRSSALVFVCALSAATGCEGATGSGGEQIVAPSLSPQGSPLTGREDEHVLELGEQRIVVYADPKLRPEVDRLFLALRDMEGEGAVFSDGGYLPIGWTTLRFAVEGQLVTLREPDYDGEPESETRPDISVSLATLARQRAVLELVQAEGEPLNFDQHVLTISGVLDLEQIYLVRVESPGGRLSGWRIAPTDGFADEDDLDSIPVYEVLRRRPSLVDAMLLPPGYMVFYSAQDMIGVVDGQDELVWQSPDLRIQDAVQGEGEQPGATPDAEAIEGGTSEPDLP